MYKFNTNPVIVKNGKRLKAKSDGRYEKVCIYKNTCTSFALYGDGTNYCRKHKLGEEYVEEEYKDEIVIHDNQDVRDIRKENISKGDKAELFIRDIMRTWFDIEFVEKTGEEMGSADIVYKFKDINHIQSLQVKTLCSTEEFRKNSYTIKYPKNGYSLNTLIIGVTTDFKKFFVLFYNEGSSKGITLTFNNKADNKYKEHIYKF